MNAHDEYDEYDEYAKTARMEDRWGAIIPADNARETQDETEQEVPQ